MPYSPTQQAVLDYAHGVIDAGFPPGLIMIDDRWSVDYGNWMFDRTRFPRPVEMTRQLHDLKSFTGGRPIDQELFVRFAQCSALFPMMQFSLAPWRVLDDQHLTAVLAAVHTRQTLLPELRTRFTHAAQTGEPILRPLAYHYSGHEHVQDHFCSARTSSAPPSWRPAPTPVTSPSRLAAG